MNNRQKFTWIGAIVLAAFLIGFWSRGHVPAAPATAAAAGRKVLYWHDPMHPAYTSDKPGIAPDCGMQLEPVYADGAVKNDMAPAAPMGTVTLAADRQQVVGVRVAEVDGATPQQSVQMLGRVAVDDTAVYRVFATSEAWIREIPPHNLGSLVAKDELLAVYFSRELLTPQQAYLFALGTRDRTAKDAGPDQARLIANQVRSAEDGLITLGMSDFQLRELARTRTATSLMEVRAPGSAMITARNVSRGLRVDRGAELFRLADISRVFVLADVFENDARFLAPGRPAKVRYNDRVIVARVSNALPLFDAATRTFKLQFEVENADFLLRPDMFVDVEVPVQLPPGITVPAEAVVDAGTRKVVYVARGADSFEPRLVETGWRFGDRVAVTRGLTAGERIVVAGTFLLDSESRLNLSAHQPAPGMARDPVCGMEVDPARALTLEYQGTTLRFCSEQCRRKFAPGPSVATP